MPACTAPLHAFQAQSPTAVTDGRVHALRSSAACDNYGLLPLAPASTTPAEIALHFDSWGYTPNRNMPRWQMLAHEIAKERLRTDNFSVVDWGSNEGFFSVAMAATFPNAWIFSLDVDKSYHGTTSPLHNHAVKLKELGLARGRNVLCRGSLDQALIEKTAALAQDPARQRRPAFHYQLSLAIFHWVKGACTSRDQFDRLLGAHLIGAKTTFIELPDPNAVKMTRCMNGRSEHRLLVDALGAVCATAEIRALGQTTLNSTREGSIRPERQSTRTVFMVRVQELAWEQRADLDCRRVVAFMCANPYRSN